MSSGAGEHGVVYGGAMRSRLVVAISVLAFEAFGCGGSSLPPQDPAPLPPPSEPAPVATVVAPTREPTPEPSTFDVGEPPPPTSSALPGEPSHDLLLHPEMATEVAPSEFTVTFETTKGPFAVRVLRRWAPYGADRFYNLVRMGYYNDVAFFRAIDGFMVQFGIHGQPNVNAAWREARIPDDPNRESNRAGTLTFATSGPGSRTVQLFVNTTDNSRLDGMGFAPFGEVIQGMQVVHALYNGYGEGAPMGRGPSQNELQLQGNDYLRQQFPKLDYIQRVRLGM